MMMEIMKIFLIAFAIGSVVIVLYGRKHQRWTNERRSHSVGNDGVTEDDLRPALPGVGERLP